MKPLRLSALAAALVLAACTSATPTDPAVSATPSFDAGPGMMGSGNGGTADSGGNTIGSGNETENSTTESGTEDEPNRSGVGTMGSGG